MPACRECSLDHRVAPGISRSRGPRAQQPPEAPIPFIDLQQMQQQQQQQ